jgi:hypothetical protein
MTRWNDDAAIQETGKWNIEMKTGIHSRFVDGHSLAWNPRVDLLVYGFKDV